MKKKKTTKETEVARNVQLLTSRPKGMSYEDYREAQVSKPMAKATLEGIHLLYSL